MANVHRGTVEVELDGETHQLRYTLNSLAEIEHRLGLTSISEILDLLLKLSMTTFRTLLWAGLLHEDARLTEQQVGEMDFDYNTLVVQVTTAITAVFQSPAEASGTKAPGGPGGNVHRPARGTGATR